MISRAMPTLRLRRLWMNPNNKTSQTKENLKMHRSQQRKSRQRSDHIAKDRSFRSTVIDIQLRVGLCSQRLQDRPVVGWRTRASGTTVMEPAAKRSMSTKRGSSFAHKRYVRSENPSTGKILRSGL
mmetsp:Transcript_12972/g.51556  ORF Transcript_12972/g.51556 Transcript_12972/m.51556 type:complete len:126 (+) Transcript_12972:1063-1440(+)